MRQLCEPYKIRYIVLSGLREVGVRVGAASVGIVQAGKAPGSCFPWSSFSWVCVCVSFLSWLRVGPVLLFWTHSHSLWGWGQVSIQSADAQEQVEGLLAENNALRTSLAALEQVQDTWEPAPIPPQLPVSLCF